MHDDTTQVRQPHVVIDGPRWAQIPEGLLYDPAMPDAAVRIYGVLYRHGQDPDHCYPSHARIADLIGASPRSIPGWLRQLEDAGWISRHARYTDQGQTSNGYTVHLTPRAVERRAPRAGERGAPALGSAPKESKGKESKVTTTPPPPSQPVLVAVPDEPLPHRQNAERLLALERFEKWWNAYPKRDGKRVGRGKCLALWLKLTPREHEAAWVGVNHYARSGWRPKDPERWLRDRLWEDWQEPAQRDGPAAAAGAAPARVGYTAQGLRWD